MDEPIHKKTDSDQPIREKVVEKQAPELEEGTWEDEQLPTSLNEELIEKIKDNPNKFIGCGG